MDYRQTAKEQEIEFFKRVKARLETLASSFDAKKPGETSVREQLLEDAKRCEWWVEAIRHELWKGESVSPKAPAVEPPARYRAGGSDGA